MANTVIRRLLYALKRQWGGTLDYVQIQLSQVNDDTGARDITKQVFCLPVIVLPKKIARKFIQDIGYLAADKNFTYGALNDFNTISFIILANDLPEGFDVNLNGYVNYLGKRYDRQVIDDLFGEAYVITVQGVSGSTAYNQMGVKAQNTLQMQQRVVYELN